MEDGLLYGLTTSPLVLWLHDLRSQWWWTTCKRCVG